jgi:hypothetical protein
MLEKVYQYYNLNFKELENFLEKVTLLKANLKYPNSVVMKFGEEKIIGEISVWNFETQKYIECEYVNLTKLENEPITIIKTVSSENVIEKLKDFFKELKEISNNNYC